jgi:ABC-type glucose/galactose transport system permease subunit
MRYFRRLPPLLRVASLLGLVSAVASLVVLVEALITSLASVPPHWSANATRMLFIGLNLGMFGGACSFAVNTYSLRFRRSDGGPFPLESWRSQFQAIAVLAALPLSALAVALVPPLDFPADVLAIGFTFVAAVGLLAAYVWLTAFGAASGRPT